jgi:hypothetical protein
LDPQYSFTLATPRSTMYTPLHTLSRTHVLVSADTARFEKLLADKLAIAIYRQRCTELFDIIVDYPDSVPALNDLKSCFENKLVRDRNLLVNCLSASYVKSSRCTLNL